MLICQKSGSQVKLTYYWKPPVIDSSTMTYFTFDLRNDSLQFIDQIVSFENNEPEYTSYSLVDIYEDKVYKSVKVYKYERPHSSTNNGQAYVFSKDYGLIAIADYFWGHGLVFTYWNGKPLPKKYSRLIQNNIAKMFMKRLEIDKAKKH
ncbi:hypothetical protein QNI16_17730 [Cytophagaceae bacterium YF14B1]|uniref:Uncharacterized protein n=1 Tax=Xanthocytophaga flava TaxID=3048013 RepID=A0AAE3QSD4_9BACT|nr:hypothetical protein [Xanthocytophaga flavus]MDJ1482351.1 hypothetical protein [Xanthocytophaga flavus]